MSSGSGKVARYLVRPRQAVVGSLGPQPRSLAPELRTTQVAAMRRERSGLASESALRTILADHRATVVHGGEQTPVTGVQIVDMTPADAAQLRREEPGLMVLRDAPLELIRPTRTRVATAAPSSTALWHLDAIGLTKGVRSKLGASGAGVRVAVLDTGIDASHPEIAGHIAEAFTFDTANWTVAKQKSSIDTDGHGTHVAGLICGKTVGVAPGARVTNGIMIPNGRGMLSDFVLALEWAVKTPEIQIVNMSAGIPGWVDGMREVIADLVAVGVLLVVATGNEGANRTRSPGNYVECLSVGASNRQGKVASFSSGGRLTSDAHVWLVPDLVAPGEGVTSSVIGGGYEAWDGTSMATPIVSGIAALLLESRRNRLAVGELQELLLESCRDLGSAPERQGRGLVTVHPSLHGTTTASRTRSQRPKAKRPSARGTSSSSGTKRTTLKKTARKPAAAEKGAPQTRGKSSRGQGRSGGR